MFKGFEIQERRIVDRVARQGHPASAAEEVLRGLRRLARVTSAHRAERRALYQALMDRLEAHVWPDEASAR